jgi:phosphoglycolate phosphatase
MHKEKKRPAKLANVKHVVWDWNGTLFDDTWLCIELANEMLSERGIPTMTKRRYQQIFDFPVIRYYERMGFDFEKESFEKLGAEFIARYEIRRDECLLYKDARRTLETLHAAGITQSVLSNYPHDTLETILRHHNIREFFDDVTGAEDVYARGKTERGRRWLARSARARHEIVLVGDTLHDHDVARELGIRSALVTIGSHARPRLKKTGAPVFDSLRAVARAVLNGKEL